MIRVELTNWMQLIFPINSRRLFFLLGDVIGEPNTQAVMADDIRGNDKMLYCTIHKTVREPWLPCPQCSAAAPGGSNGRS